MAYIPKDEIHQMYVEASDEADRFRENYPEIERLMDNGILEGLDDSLPEVNDGSLAASLFKLAKRVIKKRLGGQAIATDTDDAWISELANIRLEKHILKNATAKATPRRKLKDAARKAAGYGGQPVIVMQMEHGVDFIVPYVQDVKLEAGKDSDLDSDIIFWDVYYTKHQVRKMIDQAKEDTKTQESAMLQYQESKANYEAQNPGKKYEKEVPKPYNTWDIKLLEQILEENQEEDKGKQEHLAKHERGTKKSGIHFYVAVQRGVNAPFCLYHSGKKKPVREWSNPDPTGDVPIRYVYYYQDFINPYGIGVVKLAGGTQNVLDYMRRLHILATMVGIAPPKIISGNADDIDEDSMVLAQNANWYVGNTQVTPWQMANGMYQEMPNTIGMYKTSLDQMIPVGDTSISGSTSGDPSYSKTPAGIKMQAQALSVDDEDFSENMDELYAWLCKTMINYEFANMQGSDLVKLSDDERQVMINAGVPWPVDEAGNLVGNELDIVWDEVRATFDYEIDPDADKTQDEDAALEGKLRAYEMINADPNIDAYLQMGGKKLNRGELLSDIFSGLTNNDKIIEDISPDEQQEMDAQQSQQAEQEAMMAEQQEQPMEQPVDPEAEQESVNVQAIMEHHQVPENVAQAMRQAELQNFPDEDIVRLKDMLMADMQGAPVA